MSSMLTLVLALILSGCSLLPKAEPVVIHRYTLDYPVVETRMDSSGPVILVSRIYTRMGLASHRMMYRRDVHKVAYFTKNQWIAPPADMLEPLIVDSLESAGRFAAVVQPGSPVVADLRLDLHLAELYQDFSSRPGSVRFRIRAQLLNMNTLSVLATQQFDYSLPVATETAASGVDAINMVVQKFLPELVKFSLAAQKSGGQRPPL